MHGRLAGAFVTCDGGRVVGATHIHLTSEATCVDSAHFSANLAQSVEQRFRKP